MPSMPVRCPVCARGLGSAYRILQYARELGRIDAARASQNLGLLKSHIHTVIYRLVDRGFLVRNGDAVYSPVTPPTKDRCPECSGISTVHMEIIRFLSRGPSRVRDLEAQGFPRSSVNRTLRIGLDDGTVKMQARKISKRGKLSHPIYEKVKR